LEFEKIVSRCVLMPQHDIDTDQIIPARYLTALDRDGLKDGLFAGLRGTPGCGLDQPHARGSQVLVAGRNFGCGSSREHAVWALKSWGFRAVVAPSFGDIFKANAMKNGLLPVELPEPAWRGLLERLKRGGTPVSIDLQAETLSVSGGPTFRFRLDPFARRCLLDGVDELGYLLAHTPQIEAYEGGRP